MKFDSEKIVTELNQKWQQSQICPVCGKNEWQVNDTIFELPEFQGGNVVIGSGKLYPVIPIMCSSCGYTIFMNAIKAGAVKLQEKKENDEQK